MQQAFTLSCAEFTFTWPVLSFTVLARTLSCEELTFTWSVWTAIDSIGPSSPGPAGGASTVIPKDKPSAEIAARSWRRRSDSLIRGPSQFSQSPVEDGEVQLHP